MEIRYGTRIKVWYIFFRPLNFTAFRRIATVTDRIVPRIMKTRLYPRVFLMIR